jgi:hypothetical protein
MEQRLRLRLQSLAWALSAAVCAGVVALALALVTAPGPGWWGSLAAVPLEAGLRSGGCGFFYGLLAFHLQRADPEDGHLQAGLVGAVCGIRSLAACGGSPALGWPWDANLLGLAPSVMMELVRVWLPLWLPLVGSALLLHAIRLPTPLPPVTDPGP